MRKMCDLVLFFETGYNLSKLVASETDSKYKQFCVEKFVQHLENFEKEIDFLSKFFPEYVSDLKYDIHLISVAFSKMHVLLESYSIGETRNDMYYILHEFCTLMIDKLQREALFIDEQLIVKMKLKGTI